MEDLYKDPLVSKMWQTKGCRFKAYSRLQRRHYWSLFSISMLSVYLMAISILLLSPDLFNLKYSPNALSSISVIAALFVVVLTHHENAKNYLVRADHMHTCALEILEAYNELQAELSLYLKLKKSDQEIFDMKKNYIEKYNRVILKYPENHSERDFKLFCADNPKTFEDYGHWFVRHWERVCGWWEDSWLYLFCIIVPPTIFIFGVLQKPYIASSMQ